MIIDGKGKVLGRLGSYAAKQVLLGNKVDIINCEECVVSGGKASVLAQYVRRIDRKAPNKGPYLYRRPDMFVRRTIRGMIPFKRSRGREAYKNLKCHIGVPEIFRNEKAVAPENCDMGKLHSADYLKVKQICRALGGKI
jgi:large subunit ribosomal protein L13